MRRNGSRFTLLVPRILAVLAAFVLVPGSTGAWAAPVRATNAPGDGSSQHRTVTRPSQTTAHRIVTRRLPPNGVLVPRFRMPIDDGTTSLSMQSQPGDYIGAGGSYHYTPGDGTFSVSNNYNHVGISFYSGSHFWYLDFAAPSNQTLAVGTYDGATRYPFNETNQPGLDVYGDGRGCNELIGSFRIKQIQFDGSGNLTAFWATFEQHCEGATPTLTGDVRYNANVPVDLHAPLSVTAPFGRQVQFDISATTQDSTPVILSAGGLPDGASLVDHGNNTATFSWTPGFDQIGLDPQVVFRAQGAAGADSVTTTFHVTGLTSITLDSDPGDYIGGGQHLNFTPDDGSFGVNGSGGGVSVFFNSSNHFWDLSFSAPSGQNLQVGTYTGAMRFNDSTIRGWTWAGTAAVAT